MANSLSQERLVSGDKAVFYRENGFVQVDNVLNDDQIGELRQYMDETMNTEEGHALTTSKKGDKYYRVLNQKVHGWRDHAGLCKYTFHPKISQLAREISGFPAVRFFHDQILWKMPQDSKETAWHQDLPYWPMNEQGAFSIWIALDDVDEKNGCMKFVPKSHKVGQLDPIDLADPQDIYQYVKGTEIENQEPITVPLKAGSCTFHNGLTFHYAHANQTAKPRRAFVIIFMPDGTTYKKKSHIVTDGQGFEQNQTFGGNFFPVLAHQ